MKGTTAPENLVIPYRWLKNMEGLSDAEFRSLFRAMLDYHDGREPGFTGALAFAWGEIRDRIDADCRNYADVCEKRRHAARNRWENAKASTCMQKDANDANGNGNGSGNGNGNGSMEETISCGDSKETAPSSPDAAARTREHSHPGSNEGANFKRWDAETFRNSVRAAVEQDPDFAAIEAAFCDWWLESDPKGRPRFRLEKTWSTAGRLRSWLRREEERRCFRAGRTSASAGADRNAIGGLARNCLAGLPASETFRPRHAFLDTPPTGPKWSNHEMGENVDVENLF